MKKTGKCPKCGSSNLIIVPGRKFPEGSGRSVMIGMTAMSSAIYDRYVCSKCGFSEEYFDKENIDKLIKEFGVYKH